MKQTAVLFLYEFVMLQLTDEQQAQFEGLFQQSIEMEKDQIINFGEWYSGMEKEKVERAYQRYLNETFNKQTK